MHVLDEPRFGAVPAITGSVHGTPVVLQIAPPLTVSRQEVDRAIDILDRALRESLDRV